MDFFFFSILSLEKIKVILVYDILFKILSLCRYGTTQMIDYKGNRELEYKTKAFKLYIYL